MTFKKQITEKYSIEAKLLASASSLDQIKKMIGEYFYSKDITLDPINAHEWTVSNAKGILNDFKVVLKSSRYRFENNI